MDSSEQNEFRAFSEKVERTIYVDNLAPQVTEAVIKASFNQFGNVLSVQFITNYFDNSQQAVLVEMENPEQAQNIVSEMQSYPFMISGKPRPVRSRPAKPEMFSDRPRDPARRIVCRWVDPTEPDFEVAKKIKYLVRKHSAEAALVLQKQRAEEEKLSNQQNEMLKGNYKKFEMLDGILEDGTAKQLASRYNVHVADF